MPENLAASAGEEGSLTEVLLRHIGLHGPMSVETYWNLCLFHPRLGYYTRQDPIGEGGDFITAPEISQLFGEMIGIRLAEHWIAMGRPETVTLLECGPGRGTLMSDILRIAALVPGLTDALDIHFLETSPWLRGVQEKKLHPRHVTWHDDLSTVPHHAPLFVIGNEFLDVLPVRQFVCHNGAWHERVIRHDPESGFFFAVGGVVRGEGLPRAAQDGTIFESSPAREKVTLNLAARIRENGGLILMIDYGHISPRTGETMQAMRAHGYADILSGHGAVDLTSHVDFAAIEHALKEDGFQVRLKTQAAFLMDQGIMARATQLRNSVSDPAAQTKIDRALHRLLSTDQMGDLFKVMEVTL